MRVFRVTYQHVEVGLETFMASININEISSQTHNNNQRSVDQETMGVNPSYMYYIMPLMCLRTKCTLVLMVLKFFWFYIRTPVIKLYSWKLEINLLQDHVNFLDNNVFIIVECLECNTKYSFGFEGVIPGIPVNSMQTKQCSNCINADTLNYLTNQ